MTFTPSPDRALLPKMADNLALAPLSDQITGLSQDHSSRSLLFIDAGVDAVQTLVNGAAAGTEVHVLRSGEDAIAQITQTLLGRSGIESLQILSHGKSGGIQLGESWLDLQSLPSYVEQLKSWGTALSETADLLLYGCDVAQDATGQAFVNLLAQATGADVAASDDLTGNAALGGDWDLEYHTGTIEATALAVSDYDSVLATFSVTNTNDAGAGSLRDAIAQANTAAGADTIDFTGSTFADTTADTITLTSGELVINSDITITAIAANLLTVSGNNASRVFYIAGGIVNVSGMSIANGTQYNGGGIFNGGTLSLSNSTLSGNSASNYGGSIFNYGTLSLNNSTLSGNSAYVGGGIATQFGTLSLSNSTLIGNSASYVGGGIYNYAGTIATATNNLFADSNLVGFTPNATNLMGSAASLGLDPILRDNGGPTQTHALLPGSRAIGAAIGGTATDQRGITAVGTRDIGAFESRGFSLTTTGGTPQTINTANTFSTPLSVTVTSANNEPVAGGKIAYTAPSTGASITAPNSTATIDASGNASITAIANNTVGSYTVTASGKGISSGVDFSLTNKDDLPTLTVSGSNTYVENSPGLVIAPGLTITDPDGGPTITSTRVVIADNFNAAQDVLGIAGQTGTSGTISGLNWNYNQTAGFLTLTGIAAIATYEAVLRQVTYTNLSEAPTTGPRNIQFIPIVGNFALSSNGHYYEYVNVPATWTNAKIAAATRTYRGLTGYLATSTSVAENAALSSLTQGQNAWLGASDAANDGDWRWVTGPEAGTPFWAGTASGSAVDGRFNNWNPVEPNGVNGFEDYAELLSNAKWNDLPNSVSRGYLVEYGGTASGPTFAGVTVNIQSVNDAPINQIGNRNIQTTIGIDVANPYPAATNVSGLSGTIEKVTVTLNGMNHPWTGDLDILLVSPTGEKVLLVSDVGGSSDLINTTLILDDSATNDLPTLSTNIPIASGTYRPTNFNDYDGTDIFPGAAPTGPYGTALSAFNGVNPNGTWQLFVRDDYYGYDGQGNIVGGWDLTLTTTGGVVTTFGPIPLTVTTGEDIAFAFTGTNQISISDVDTGSSDLSVNLAVASGTLTLGNTTGLTAATGNTSSSLTYTGTLAALNAALATLSYKGNLNFNGTDTLTITTNDLGNSGTGGPLSDIDTVTINVTSSNDAPTGTDKTITLLEDGTYTLTAADFGFSDTSDPTNSLLAVKIVSLAAAGTLKLNGVAVTANDVISPTDIAANKLTFTPVTNNANGTGYSNFTFQLQDNGGTANGGVDLDPLANTITFDVTPVNDVPSFTKGTDQTIAAGSGAQSIVNWATGFNPGGGTDEATQTATYEIVTNSNTSLFAVAPTIAADGTLTYTPSTTSGTATIEVRVKDNGGTANSGVDTSAIQTFTIAVNPQTVSLSAIDATATEALGDTGLYRINRDQSGGTQAVTIDISGTAAATDYSFTLDAASIAAGATINQVGNTITVNLTDGLLSADLIATATDDIQAEADETIQLDLAASTVYTIDPNNTGIVTIAQNDFVVINTSDSGEGSLRQAILNANTIAGVDTITFEGTTFTDATADVITLTSGELAINSDLSITSTGANLLTLSGNNVSRVFYVAGTVNMNGLMITNGTSDQGGGIFINGGNLSLSNSTLSGNSASSGGGIYNIGTLTLNNSALSGNSASYGGGVYNWFSNLILSNSTFSGNSAFYYGGGIYNYGGTLYLSNSTLSGNSAPYGGGGIYNDINAAIAIATDTNNLFADSSLSAFTPSGTDRSGTAASLGLDPTLRNNGGPTQTHALLPGSIAINAATGGTTTDQRGIAAVGTRDIGAFESQGFTITTSSGTPQSSPAGGTFTTPLEVTVTSAYSEPVAGGIVTYNAPATGASTTITTIDATIDASGKAIFTPIANNTPGSYTVTAGANGIALPTSFSLTNGNNAPVLSLTSIALNAISEDPGAPSGAVGTLISALVDLNLPIGGLDNVTDTDIGAVTGIAITAADPNGTWFYSIDNGTNWAALGTVADTTARLLDPNARLYFQPNANYNGTIADAITFRAWDTSSGTNGTIADTSTNGGGTAFSSATDIASIVINSLNDLPTGAVTISGTATEGQTLTVADTLGDVDGLGLITYQWQAGGIDIVGATGNSFLLSQTQIGKAITVKASYTDLQNTPESVSSAQTGLIANANDMPIGTVTIAGIPALGQTLTVSDDIRDADGLGVIGYQWQADGLDIVGATGLFLTLGSAQIGKAITAKATYIDGFGTSEAVLSTATGIITGLQTPNNLTTTAGVAAQSVENWATDLTQAGYPVGLNYVITVDRPELFAQLPVLSSTGQLSYELKPYLNTNALVNVKIEVKQVDGSIDPNLSSNATLKIQYKPEALIRNRVTNELGLLYIDRVTQLTAERRLTYGPNFGAKSGQNVTIDPTWSIADTGDFNRDGIADLLLHSQSGDEVAMWMMGNEGQVMSTHSLQGQDGKPLKTGNLNWKVVGFADIDRDNVLDIVWHNQQSDEVGFWFMNADGINVRSYDYLRDSAGNILKTGNTLWQVKAVADFDGDGDSDLLFQLPELNQTAIVHLSGKTTMDYEYLTAPVQANLQIRGVGDSNGDGIADIDWQTPDNTSVLIQTITHQNGQTQSNSFTTISSNSPLEAIGDLDENNTSDLLFHNIGANSLMLDLVNPTGSALLNGTLQQQGTSFQFGDINWNIVQTDEFGDVTP